MALRMVEWSVVRVGCPLVPAMHAAGLFLLVGREDQSGGETFITIQLLRRFLHIDMEVRTFQNRIAGGVMYMTSILPAGRAATGNMCITMVDLAGGGLSGQIGIFLMLPSILTLISTHRWVSHLVGGIGAIPIQNITPT